MVSRIPLTPFDDQEVSMGTNFGIYGYLYTKMGHYNMVNVVLKNGIKSISASFSGSNRS